MKLSRFVHSQTGKYMMSIILGFGLSCLFREVCKGTNCVIFHAPPLEDVDGQTYKHNGKCYKYSSSSIKCDNKKKSVEFADGPK